MMLQPAAPEAYKLLHDGSVALAEVEAAGMRVDIDYLDRTIDKTKARIKKLEGRLQDCEEFRLQRRRFGVDTNLTSRDQLAMVLFEDMGHPCHSYTGTGRPQLDETALERIGTKYAKGFVRLEKLNKVLGTYLMGVRREVEGEYLHPFFNLHRVVTYRSSSSDPNFQNIPIRDPMIAEIIRRAFIARDGHVIVEIDISGAEVRVAACYHKDPTMMNYIHDPTTDMHRDMSRECYLIDEVPKAVRAQVKGGFVFAEFYGDYYRQVCQNLWEAVTRYGLTTAEGVPMHEHLAEHGLGKLGECDPKQKPRPGTFEHHIMKVEEAFWGTRFPVYSKWKERWYKDYRAAGGFHTLTGFTCRGLFTRNEVINYPVQGSAFHCLLWSLVQLNAAMRRAKMRSLLVGQIHDSIVADVHLSELDDFLGMAKQIMTVDLVRAWPWIITPMEIEAEVAPEGGSWFDKKEVAL